MKQWLLALAFAVCATPALATCPSPLTGKDASGTTQNFGVTVDGSGNCYGNVAIVDGTAAANKAAINSSGQVAVQLPPGAATAANQTAPIPDCGSLPCTNKIGVLAPLTATSTQTKVTITTAGTYQQYIASNTARKGCTIQFITASHTGYVFFGAAPADTTTSWQLGPGQSLNCNVGSEVLTDAIQLTSSNNSDVFVVNSW